MWYCWFIFRLDGLLFSTFTLLRRLLGFVRMFRISVGKSVYVGSGFFGRHFGGLQHRAFSLTVFLGREFPLVYTRFDFSYS